MKIGMAVLEILKREGVDTIYGYPLNVLTEFAAMSGVRPVITRAERTAGHMADAIARTSSGTRIGVFFTQHGPGIENAMGAIAQAYSESVPLLVIPMGYARKNAQFEPNFSAAASIRTFAKSVESLTSADDVSAVFRRAFSLLRSGRGGPVVVEIPVDLWNAEISEPIDYQPVVGARYAPDPTDVERAADLLINADRPLLYVGQGVHYARAWNQLRALAEWLSLPVMTTLEGKSAFPEDHPLALGAGGSAMPKTVHHYLGTTDVILGVGCSFTESSYAVRIPRGPKIIHATLDPRHLNKDVPATIGLIGDAALTLEGLIQAVKRRVPNPRPRVQVERDIDAIRTQWLEGWESKLSSAEVPLSPYRVIRDLMDTVDVDNTIITHDAGHPRDQLATFWKSRTPLTYLGWGKTTQLGYSLGLAMGAKMGNPDKLCINVWGDAAFGFTGLELETAVRERIPVLSILFNNSCMATELNAMAASTQKYRSTDIGGSYAEIARALGAYAERVTEPDGIIPAIRRGIAQTQQGVPALLEFITNRDLSLSKYPIVQ